jgi:hypothetical protein
MKKQFISPLIEISDPDHPPRLIRQIGRIEDSLNYPGRFFSFYVQGNYLSIVLHWIISPKDKQPFLATEQLDAPLEILTWFVNKFTFFQKNESDGGMRIGQIVTDTDLIQGEDITLSRAMDAGNARREGGYIIDNFSRSDDFSINKSTRAQSVIFSDSFMFQGGLQDLWKDLAEKYENGTL